MSALASSAAALRRRAGDRRPGALLSRDAGAIAWLDESGGVVGALVHAASVRDAGDRRARARRRRSTRSPSSACAWAARSAARKCRPTRGRPSPRSARGRRGGPVRVRLTRAARHGAHRQAPSLSSRATRPGFASDGRIEALRLALYSDGGWSLDLSEPIMWRVALSLRQRLPPAGGRGRRPRVPHAQDVADRVPRLRRTAGHARHRGDPVAGGRSGCRCPRDVVRERNFYRDGDTTHYGQPVDDAGAHRRRSGRELKRHERLRRAPRRRSTRFNAAHPHAKRGLAITPVKFGISFTATFFNQARRARADLSRRQRAGESRRHRDGPGAVHEDPADRRRQPRRAARPRARDADAHRQGAEHVGRRRPRPAPI